MRADAGLRARSLADYKTPERVIFLPVLPKGLTGKVQRSALKDLAELGAVRQCRNQQHGLTLIPSTAQKISLENRISMIECGHRSRISE